MVNPDRSKLVIAREGIASYPACSGETFELFDCDEVVEDTATFALRKGENGFERKDPHGEFSWQATWHPEGRRVGCTNCRQREPWPAYDLAANGARRK